MLTTTFDVTVGDYTLISLLDTLPHTYIELCKHAQLVDEIDLSNSKGKICFVAVRDHQRGTFLIVAQKYEPEVFSPGAMIVPETQTLFIGAGERLLAYNLDRPAKLWEDQADTGFWSWERYGDYVVMSAELELAAWTISGHKLWSTFVEPPWEYSVDDKFVHLDVMGKKSTFPLQSGPGSSLQGGSDEQ